MALLPPDVFQPPSPAFLLLIPPGSKWQWPIRAVFLLLTFFVTLPLTIVLVPISICLLTQRFTWLRHLAPLPLHPTTIAPHTPFWKAYLRGVSVYVVGGGLWAITGFGNAPNFGLGVSRCLTAMARWLVETIGRTVDPRTWANKLVVAEEVIQPAPKELLVGIMGIDDVKHQEMVGFNLTNFLNDVSTSKEATQADVPRQPRRVFLFFGGGGYVTGWPLVHPFVFSLARTFPPEKNDSYEGLPRYSVFAPDVRKSLSSDRSFPVPIIDALSAYVHLRTKGYQASEIVVMGDSAGAGLCWSLVAYLAVLHEKGKRLFNGEEVGLPGGMVLISVSPAPGDFRWGVLTEQPWLSLPPVRPSGYPDTIDEPMLLNAARCYLARFPVLKHRPDPFNSEWQLMRTAWQQRYARAKSILSRMTSRIHGTPVQHRKRDTQERVAAEVFDPEPLVSEPEKLADWLDVATFKHLSSHHSFVSPGTNTSCAFVRQVLDIVAENQTRILIHHGTAEWFYEPAMRLAAEAKEAGVDVTVVDEVGGFHIEACVMPAELGGSGGRLVEAIRNFERGLTAREA